MGVDLALYAVNDSKKAIYRFYLERKSSLWEYFKAMPSEPFIKDVTDYSSYDCDEFFNGKYNETRLIKRNFPVLQDNDAYGNQLKCVDVAEVTGFIKDVSVKNRLVLLPVSFEKFCETLSGCSNIILWWH